MELDRLRDVAASAGVTINDVFVATASGALRRYLLDQQQRERGEEQQDEQEGDPEEQLRLPLLRRGGGSDNGGRSQPLEAHEPRRVQRRQRRGQQHLPVCALVAVNLRDKADAGAAARLGNEFGLAAVDLPTDVDDPRARLRESSGRMSRAKRSWEPHATATLLSLAGWAPRRLQRAGVRAISSRGSILLSNLRGCGPSSASSSSSAARGRRGAEESRCLAGSPISELMLWSPQTGGIGAGFSMVSFAGKVQLTLSADPAAVSDPDRLVAMTLEAFEELEKAADIPSLYYGSREE